jgi:endonuclease/exonuclease/phosphatase family metal-dependent hydrolase
MTSPKPNNRSLISWKAALVTLLFVLSNATTFAENPPIKVMSFNIRYGKANDGANSWEFRKDLVIETIKTFNPDLMGNQEALKFQTEFLKAGLPKYGFHGVGRDDGNEGGEYTSIFYRKSRFEMVDSGHFWLSESPEEPGSVSWDSSLTRMVSWVLLNDLEADGRQFIYGNTHFDHRGRDARLQSAKLIRSRIEEAVNANIPVVLSGDFNTNEDLEPYKQLTTGGPNGSFKLIDSYRVSFPNRSEFESTFSTWNGRRKGSRIDWILHTKEFETLNATINYTQDRGRNPSDHYPVQATLRLK